MPPPVGQRKQVVVQNAAGQRFRAGTIAAQLLAAGDRGSTWTIPRSPPIDRLRGRGLWQCRLSRSERRQSRAHGY